MEFTKATETASSYDVEENTCVLMWCLSKRTEPTMDNMKLTELHHEVNQLSELVGATALEVGATHGMLKCAKMASVSAADTAVRLGQLLCRWATIQEPELGLSVGVAIGVLQSIVIPGTNTFGYWGKAVTAAKQLAEKPPRETCVHLKSETRETLRIFERLPFKLAEDGAYFLEPWVEAVDEDGHLDTNGLGSAISFGGNRDLTPATPGSMTALTGSPRKEGEMGVSNEDRQALRRLPEMSLPEFSQFLERNNVDTSKFGRGQAKSVEDLLKDLAKQKSYLKFSGLRLERRVELVRINLFAQGPDGTDRSLKIAMEIMEDGRTRTRNQKLACTVAQGQTWREAVKDSFKDKFKISFEVFDAHFAVQDNWYKEEKLYSPSCPGIKTVYLTHEVRIRIATQSASDLSCIGLPDMDNFSTQSESKTSHWTWKGPDEEVSNADMLTQLLQDHHISIADFEHAAFQDLVEEVYETKMSTLSVSHGELLRHLEIVKIWLQAEVLSVPHVLVTKSKMQYGQRTAHQDRPISMRMASGQNWQEALKLALTQRLGLNHKFQEDHLIVDLHSYQQSEEIELSKSYPGLKSVYRIHEVTLSVAHSQSVFTIGLPEGNDFVFSRHLGESNRNLEEIVVHQFGWKPISDLNLHRTASSADARMQAAKASQKTYKRGLVDSSVDLRPPAVPDPKRRVEAPEPLSVPERSQWKSSYAVQEMMKDKTSDWKCAKRAAKRIRDADYTVGMFLDDCKKAFPELKLYQVDGPTSSGRSGDDEYQRTIGALFAVYWLMRLNLDGGTCFAYGVNNSWLALSGKSESPVRSENELKQRASFLDSVKWPLFEEVLFSAGMLKKAGGQTVHDEERTLAMLVLTAIHDIMKVQDLLPTVDAKVAEFAGYKAGETINDHDTALGYILEHVPNALPSYAGLPKSQRDPVKFTQCNMEYNMGWLVQAEAPPGPLFRKFRQIIRSGGAKPADISFYFVHWLTDLAGAEPCPMEGCEKFVLKFPQRVLASFLSSFKYVQGLNSQTESQVYEEYLKWRWTDNQPKLPPVLGGKGSLAQLRLTVMAQGHAEEVLEAYRMMPQTERDTLDAEMARTGCQGQSYVVDPQPSAGPAFLVYYAPALLQKNAASSPFSALMVLAEVLKQARSLWPLQDDSGDASVIVRIDAIKDADLHTLVTMPVGEFWGLERSNNKEAVVKQLSLLGPDGSPEISDWSFKRILKFSITPPAQVESQGSGKQSYVQLSDDGERREGSKRSDRSAPEQSQNAGTAGNPASGLVKIDEDILLEGDQGEHSSASGCCSFLSLRRKNDAKRLV